MYWNHNQKKVDSLSIVRNKIVLDQLIKDFRVWIKKIFFSKGEINNSNLGSQISVLKTQKASLHYCTRPAKNVFCTVEWTKTDPRLFDAMICQIHLHSAKIYLNWGLQNSTRPFLCQCSSKCPWVKKKCRHKNKVMSVRQDAHFSPAKYIHFNLKWACCYFNLKLTCPNHAHYLSFHLRT